jgi:hypothetical protein
MDASRGSSSVRPLFVSQLDGKVDLLNTMSFTVEEFESTPNPNAMKCWLDRPISHGPRSFLSAEMAREDPIAHALFERAGATAVLFNGDWVTVNKPPDAHWATVKRRIKQILAEAHD